MTVGDRRFLAERMFLDAKVLVTFRASWSAARRKYVFWFTGMEKNVLYIWATSQQHSGR